MCVDKQLKSRLKIWRPQLYESTLIIGKRLDQSYKGLSAAEDKWRYIYTVLLFDSRFHTIVLAPL